MKILLERRVDSDLKDNCGRTPLSNTAAYKSNTGLVKILLERGAEPDISDRDSRTPIS